MLPLNRRTGRVLASLAIVATTAMALTAWRTVDTKPAEPEPGPMPRTLSPTPVYADLTPAANPTRLTLQDDGRKVFGWISGGKSLTERKIGISVEGKQVAQAIVDDDNTFVWKYTLEKPTAVQFQMISWNASEVLTLRDTITVAPTSAEKEPTVFFVVDRTAYRPTQNLHFAGFLRKLNAAGEFEPIANTDVDVELVSQQKQTKIFKVRLTSDATGKVANSYVFSDADPLDTYSLRIPGYRGEAKLLLGEYRKSKIRLKISGDVKDEKLTLKFETVDFLDKPVPASKLSFVAQVVEKKKADKQHALKAEDFAYFLPSAHAFFDTDQLADEDHLLWVADGILPSRWDGGASHAVAQFNNDMTLNGTEPGTYTIDLKKEWKLGTFSINIQGVVTDANGREQRASHAVSLACGKPGSTAKLELGKELFAAGEKIVAKLTTADGVPSDGATSLIVMRLSPAPVGTGYNDIYGAYGYSPNGSAYYGRRPRYAWNAVPQQETARRTLVTAMPFKGDIINLRLSEPGAYKLIAVTHDDDGRTTQTEVGCAIKNGDDLHPFSLRLDTEEFNAGDRLMGSIYSRFTGARILLTLRDSAGLQWWKPLTLDASGFVAIDEALPSGLKYGCVLDLQYLDNDNINHVLGRMLRINPKDRILNVTANLVNRSPDLAAGEVKPGEIVALDLSVDRTEEVDLVVSVYDQALLGINPDKSTDVRNFYLADERVRQMQADELLRRKLGNLTIDAISKKAEEMLKSEKGSLPPAMQPLKVMVDRLKQGYINSADLVTMLRLSGVDIQMNPAWFQYHGHAWNVHPQQAKLTYLHELIRHRHGEYYLQFNMAGEMLLINEMHPSWKNINPVAYFNNYYGRYALQNQLGYERSAVKEMQFGNMARGDSARSLSGNASNSFAPEAQGFISHMPAMSSPVPLLNVGPDQGHIEVRRDFSDSAYWNAQVRTDANGKARVEFKVPDSLTNWQVVVTAVSKKMHVGQGKSNFRTFKPVMIWPMLPRTFTEGDVVHLFGSVHNRTAQPQQIKARLKVENGEILSPAEKLVDVPAGESVNVYWTFRAGHAGYTQLLMSADSPGGADASLKRLPVTRAAAEQVVTKSGQVKSGAMFTIPKDVDLSSARLEISFAPSLAADMADTLNFLVDYPYGCVEQTMSRFLPAVKVAQILKQYQVDHPELNKKMPLVAAAGIKRLLELQQSDGGWGWHNGSQSHEMMTPYALYGLLQAEKGGHTIPNETAIQRGLQRLRHFIDVMNEQQAADRIYCMYVYSHREKLTDQWIDFLSSMQKAGKLSDYANALCLEMCIENKKLDLAKKFADDLRAKAQKAGGGQVFWKTAGFSRWMEDPHEVTAAVMKALVALDKDDPLIDGILGYFAATKRGDRWNSTKDTAMILFAMCDYLAKANYNPEAKNELSFTLNGKDQPKITFDDKLTRKISIDGEQLKNGDNPLTFETEMTGVMYRAVLKYWKSGRDIPAMDKGIAVTRKFHLWDEKTKQFSKELKDGDTIERGAYICCDTTANYGLPQGMRYMLMECPKPATAEVIPIDDPRFRNLQPNTGYALREERLASVAFHHEQTGQTVQNRVIMLAELAGDYVVPPAFVELMYQTETRGHSGTFSIRVIDK